MKQTSATSVMAAFGISIIAKALFVVSCVMQYRLLCRPTFSMIEAQANDARQRFFAFSNPPIVISAIVVLLVWVYHAKKRVIGLGMRGAEYSPGLSVGTFFIPFANLFLPFAALRELWRASINPVEWKDQKTSPLVGCWWASWLVNSLFPLAVLVSSRIGTGREVLKRTTLGLTISAALAILSFTLTIVLVRSISRQINRSAEAASRVDRGNLPPLLTSAAGEPLPNAADL